MVVDRWHKVHPDMELGTTFERYEKLRSLKQSRNSTWSRI